jgi:Zn-dependent peptidase ImmA (M78 family)
MYHNNNYAYYKEARDKAWEVLIKCNITSLPVNLSTIANLNNIYVIPYSSGYKPKSTSEDEDGFSFIKEDKIFIFYNDKKPLRRIRFTLAHELGHCLLGHLSSGRTHHRNYEQDLLGLDVQEMQANVFARDVLMPATVLHSLNICSSEDIVRLCNVTSKSAQLRYKRLIEVEKRGMFNKHPLERQVYLQFSDYIKKALDSTNT